MTPARARRKPALVRFSGRRAAAAAATLAASAAVLTAVPGVAAAATTSANVPTVLHMGPGNETVRTGTKIDLGVHLFSGSTNLSNKLVLFYYRSAGQPWHFWHEVDTGSNGEAFIAYTAGGTLQFTARFRGDSVYAPSASAAYTYTAYTPQTSSATTLGQEMVNYAAAQAGKPYEYGAAGPNAFDCSGLVMYVAAHFGISLPHDAAAQYNDTTHIPQSEMRPGDLLFFTDSSGIYHVGIYAGGGELWHAPHSGTVVQRNAIWTSSYLVGRLS